MVILIIMTLKFEMEMVENEKEFVTLLMTYENEY